jgi:uncharacterized membrane protein (DUF485 family)
MDNVLIAIFSIPGALILAAGLMVPLISSSHAIEGGYIFGVGAILAGIFALVANIYAIRTSKRYKHSSVATLAVVLPWISAIAAVLGVLWGLQVILSP